VTQHDLWTSDIVLEARPWHRGQIFMPLVLALTSGPVAVAVAVAVAFALKATALVLRAALTLTQAGKARLIKLMILII